MQSDDPDLEAFETNLCATIQARELGKTSALVSNICPNASDPQEVCILSKQESTMAHHLIASLIWTTHQMILKISTEWKFEAHLYFLADSRSAGNTYEDTVWSAVESSIYQLFLFLSTAWKFLQFGGRTRQGIVGAADLRQCTCKIGEQKTFQTLRTWPGADSIGGRLCHWQTKQSKLHKSHKKQGKAVTCQ